MSFALVELIKSTPNYETPFKTKYIARFVCDTLGDLPQREQNDYIIDIGSTCIVVETNSEYRVSSAGTWYLVAAGVDVYTKSEVDALLSGKADTASTLSGYGITNAYTKTETDNLLSTKITLSDVFGIPNRYIPEEDSINLNDYYTQGIYIKQFSAHVSTFLNTPFDGSANFPYAAFKLIVEYINSNNNIMQTIIPLTNTSTFYKRVRMTGTSGTWRSWFYFQGVERV